MHFHHEYCRLKRTNVKYRVNKWRSGLNTTRTLAVHPSFSTWLTRSQYIIHSLGSIYIFELLPSWAATVPPLSHLHSGTFIFSVVVFLWLVSPVLFDMVVLLLLSVLSSPFIAGTFGTFIVAERLSKAKHLQMVAGVKESAYWLSSYSWDILNLHPNISSVWKQWDSLYRRHDWTESRLALGKLYSHSVA